MTCTETADIIYKFCEERPSSQEERELRDHLGVCEKCRDFIEQLGKRFQLGDFNVSCGEIPNELIEALSRIMRSLDHT